MSPNQFKELQADDGLIDPERKGDVVTVKTIEYTKKGAQVQVESMWSIDQLKTFRANTQRDLDDLDAQIAYSEALQDKESNVDEGIGL